MDMTPQPMSSCRTIKTSVIHAAHQGDEFMTPVYMLAFVGLTKLTKLPTPQKWQHLWYGLCGHSSAPRAMNEDCCVVLSSIRHVALMLRYGSPPLAHHVGFELWPQRIERDADNCWLTTKSALSRFFQSRLAFDSIAYYAEI